MQKFMIPYDYLVTKAQIAGQSIVEYTNDGITEKIKSLWQTILNVLDIKESNK